MDTRSPATPKGAERLSARTTLRMDRTYAAPADRVFAAWTSEEVLRRWFHAGADWETTEAAVDLRVGGDVRVVMRDPAKDAEYGGGGRYTEVDPPNRLAFTWVWGRREPRDPDRDRFRGGRWLDDRPLHSQRPPQRGEAARSRVRLEQVLRQPPANAHRITAVGPLPLWHTPGSPERNAAGEPRMRRGS